MFQVRARCGSGELVLIGCSRTQAIGSYLKKAIPTKISFFTTGLKSTLYILPQYVIWPQPELSTANTMTATH